MALSCEFVSLLKFFAGPHDDVMTTQSLMPNFRSNQFLLFHSCPFEVLGSAYARFLAHKTTRRLGRRICGTSSPTGGLVAHNRKPYRQFSTPELSLAT